MSYAAFEINSFEKRHCIIFGLGLIGSSIAHCMNLRTKKLKSSGSNSTNWADSNTITEPIREFISNFKPKSLDIVWSAGQANFSANNAAMKLEFDVYKQTVATISKIKGVAINVNFISSAGGLYEYSHYIRSINDISPSRPYSKWKLEQESVTLDMHIPTRIYRISSVYGAAHTNTHAGLINRIVSNCKTRSLTSIYARQDTMRDYIFNVDVGNYIATNICENVKSDIQILATGRAVSINMLLNIIAKITNIGVKATFVPEVENDKDIIFSSALVPPTLNRTSLEEGIRLVNSFNLT